MIEFVCPLSNAEGNEKVTLLVLKLKKKGRSEWVKDIIRLIC